MKKDREPNANSFKHRAARKLSGMLRSHGVISRKDRPDMRETPTVQDALEAPLLSHEVVSNARRLMRQLDAATKAWSDAAEPILRMGSDGWPMTELKAEDHQDDGDTTIYRLYKWYRTVDGAPKEHFRTVLSVESDAGRQIAINLVALPDGAQDTDMPIPCVDVSDWQRDTRVRNNLQACLTAEAVIDGIDKLPKPVTL